ncbi:copper homeostasis protein CutC [Pedobacter boryungensis]|uniref:PF03932 family protein CutC n=1 Tax=Pedobacter boryungensis TaxID=869962 RepID=A0ABX2D9N2_9SPHI|nr:copper homeostasis protein CutC [Pedobacter boryungensis]NQX30745.1 copper homeostasis protein CutC [Pedobacter boryungensis]
MSKSLEICANSYSSAVAAQNGGAIRVELCENMAEGGTTPSYGQIKLCKERLSIEIWPIIRPRGGDFLYNADEFELMKEDIKICKELNCNGVVMGILTPDGEIDKIRCKELIELAKPMPVSFHRAFDMSNDLEKALEDLIELGFVRVLTSGGFESAFTGMEFISKLVRQANGRIEVMPGAGIYPDNIKEIAAKTSAKVFHSSARVSLQSKMQFRNQSTKMGSIEDEYQYQQTSEEIVKQLTSK